MKNIKKIWGLPQRYSRYVSPFAVLLISFATRQGVSHRYANCQIRNIFKFLNHQIFKLSLLAVLMLVGGNIKAQLSQEEAIELAWQEHSLLQQRDLQIEQQAALKDARKQLQFTTFTYSWEELDPAFTQGIHSLNLQQNFNLPAVAKSQRTYQEAQMQVASARKEMTKNDLRREIARLYQQLCWQQSRQALQEDLLALYQDFERIASRQAELGETGQLPVLAASRAAAQAQLDLQNWQADQQILLAKWQLWLPKTEAKRGIQDSILEPLAIDTSKALEDNPVLAYYQQQISAQTARKEMVASQLKPQLVTGLQLQLVDGEAPFFGGQIGLAAPLFRKGYKAQLRGVDLAVAQQKEQLNWQEQQLGTQLEVVLRNIQKLKANLNYYEEELFPLYEKQIALAKKAYELGELNYNDYLQELLRYTQNQNAYWDNLLSYNLWILELNYLMNQ